MAADISRLGQGQQKTWATGPDKKLLATGDRTERSDGRTQSDDDKEKCRWPGGGGKGGNAKVRMAGGMQVLRKGQAVVGAVFLPFDPYAPSPG